MATLVRIVTEDSVLERVAGVAPGMLHRVRGIEATLRASLADAQTVEERDVADRQHMESLLELGTGAIAVGRLALWEGLRGFAASDIAQRLGLSPDRGVTSDREAMVSIIEAQANRLYHAVPGVNPSFIERENHEHRMRCARAIEAVNAGVVDAIAWSDEPLTPIQQRIEQCDILSLP